MLLRAAELDTFGGEYVKHPYRSHAPIAVRNQIKIVYKFYVLGESLAGLSVIS